VIEAVFIGAGNLATSLATELNRHNVRVSQIYSRTEESAGELAGKLGCAWTTSTSEIRKDADWYIFLVKDAALPGLIRQIEPNEGLWLHTAGSIPIDVFEGYIKRYGVLYPLQTFSKSRTVDFSVIPFLIEANNESDVRLLTETVATITSDIRFLTSEQRKQVHLAAVFACNFTNHLYHLAYKLLKEKNINPEILLPLIDETVAKVHAMTPEEAQTGPAVRYDENIINNHLDALEDEDVKALYRLLSQSIYKVKHTK